MKITKTRDEWYNDYMDYRLSFKYKKPANDFVRCFLNWCDRTYPKTKFLNQSPLLKKSVTQFILL